MTEQHVPVLIVGGSLVGLSMSLFLAHQGIPSLVVERHPGPAIHPRVASLTARTMELFRTVGLEPAIRRVEPTFDEAGIVPLVDSLVGRELDRLMEDMSAYFTNASPARGSLIAQDVLEPLLRAHAERAGADVRYATELLTFAPDEAGVTATLRERTSGATRRVRASYLVAADGSGSGTRRQLGIAQHGAGVIHHVISMILKAELMELFRRRRAIMCFVNNDAVPLGALVPYPASAGRPDIFRLDIPYDPEAETVAAYDEARCRTLIRAAVGLPDLPVRLTAVLSWEMAARVADRFQQGRVFLVGDAARVQPPTGALGGNTGIAEAHNLAWKLAAVLRGAAGPDLLATYDAERRPVADLTVEQVTRLSQEHQGTPADGITVDILVVNMGYRYQTGAILSDDDGDTLAAAVQHPSQWTGQPGTRAPHLTLARNGRQISTLDLFGGEFMLLVGAAGQPWRAAARGAAERLAVPLTVQQIGRDLVDVHGHFGAAYGLTATGASLVRPDGIVGWRAQAVGADPDRALERALTHLLCR